MIVHLALWTSLVSAEGPSNKYKIYTETVMGRKMHFVASPGPTTSTIPPVLLLHGAAFSSKTWLEIKFFQNLSRLTAVVAVDLPGFGESEPLPSNISGNRGDYLLHLMQHLRRSTAGSPEPIEERDVLSAVIVFA